MQDFKYSHEKNALLKMQRDIGFEEIIDAIYHGHYLGSEDHPNQLKYPNQKIMYVRVEDEVYVVPFIRENDGSIFLKTAFLSRKARKKMLSIN